MVASWMSNPSVKSLHIAGVSPVLDCATRYWNLERYVWNPSSFRVETCFRAFSSSLAVSSAWYG